MKILYLTTNVEDYLSDSMLYGLRMKYGSDLVDYPRKDSMYNDNTNAVDYGTGFTLWGLLDDKGIDRSDVEKKVEAGYFDLVVFSDIYRQQEPFSHWNVYLLLDELKYKGKKFAFLDGTDDGKPTVYDALHWGTYFKRENPYMYPGIKIIGLSIPEQKLLRERPAKIKNFARYCQVDEAFESELVKKDCNKERFTVEKDYYTDLAASKYGLGMKKSGWDTPRFMEYAANWCVPCIYTAGWPWDGKTWYEKPRDNHPIGLVDMQNCVLWDNYKTLEAKIKIIEDSGAYDRVSKAANDWAKTKTCEYMADYFINNL